MLTLAYPGGIGWPCIIPSVASQASPTTTTLLVVQYYGCTAWHACVRWCCPPDELHLPLYHQEGLSYYDPWALGTCLSKQAQLVSSQCFVDLSKLMIPLSLQRMLPFLLQSNLLFILPFPSFTFLPLLLVPLFSSSGSDWRKVYPWMLCSEEYLWPLLCDQSAPLFVSAWVSTPFFLSYF
jgi:hypothetical protein